ncbi:unnamed protein product [Rhizophagus irregularis]|nr:unnamed protein product [Rhizophagus irregularis]
MWKELLTNSDEVVKWNEIEVEVMKWNEMEVEERNGSRSDKVERKEERIVNINKGKKTYTTLKNMYNLLKAKEATTKKIKSRKKNKK